MRLNVHWFGPAAGEPLLAIHGVTGHGRRFAAFAPTALPDRRVLAVDLRGHGRSGWEPPWSLASHLADLRETLDAEGITEPVDVMGHSFGGLLALALLAASPERVRRLVLLDPAIALPASYCAERAHEAVSLTGWESLAHALAEREAAVAPLARRFIPAEIAEHVVQGADGRFRARFLPEAAVTAWSEMAAPAPLPATGRPTLILRALHDDYVQDATLLRPLAAALGHDLDVVGLECSHMIYWEAPDEAAEAIERFLS